MGAGGQWACPVRGLRGAHWFGAGEERGASAPAAGEAPSPPRDLQQIDSNCPGVGRPRHSPKGKSLVRFAKLLRTLSTPSRLPPQRSAPTEPRGRETP